MPVVTFPGQNKYFFSMSCNTRKRKKEVQIIARLINFLLLFSLLQEDDFDLEMPDLMVIMIMICFFSIELDNFCLGLCNLFSLSLGFLYISFSVNVVVPFLSNQDVEDYRSNSAVAETGLC